MSSVNFENLDLSSILDDIGQSEPILKDVLNVEVYAFEFDPIIQNLIKDPEVGWWINERITIMKNIQYMEGFRSSDPIDKLILAYVSSSNKGDVKD